MVDADLSDNAAGEDSRARHLRRLLSALDSRLEYGFRRPALLPNVVAWLAGWLLCVASLFFVIPALRSFRSPAPR